MPTGLIEYQNNRPSHYQLIRDGIKGNYDVIWRMVDIVRDTTLLDKGFEDGIKQLVASKDYNSYTDAKTLFSFLYDFVKNKVEYLQDIQGKTESIKDARTTLHDEYGDCDDHAILNASILAVLGYEPCFVIAKYKGSDSYQHVYTITRVNGERYVFDTTINNGNLNDEVKDLDTQEICVFDERAETDGIQSIIRNIKNLVTTTRRNAQTVAPQLAGFLPLGFIGNKVVASMFKGIEEDQSLNEIGSQISSKLTDIIIELQNGRISKSLAVSRARKEYSQFYAKDFSKADQYTLEIINKKLTKKLSYIDNFNTIPTSSGTDLMIDKNTMVKVVLGIAVVSVIYKISKV